MTVSRVENQKKWRTALLIILGLSIFSCSLTFGSMVLSEAWLWLTIFFCWADMMLFSAVIIMFFGLITNGEFPFTGRWWVGAPQGCLVGGFLFLAVATAFYFDGYSDYLSNIACFGTMMGLMGFYLGAFGYRSYLVNPNRHFRVSKDRRKIEDIVAAIYVWGTFVQSAIISQNIEKRNGVL